MGRVQAGSPENSSSADGSPAADDLLAQLAGEDIDRMLAEAEVEASPISVAAPVDVAAPQSNSAADQEKLTQDLDAILNEMDQGAGPPNHEAPATSVDEAISRDSVGGPGIAATSPNVSPVDSQATSASIDGLIDEIEKSPPPETVSSPSAPAAVAESAVTGKADKNPEPASSDIDTASDVQKVPSTADGALTNNEVAPAAIPSPAQTPTRDAAPASEAPATTPVTNAASPKPVAEPAAPTAAHDSVQSATTDDDGSVPVYIRLLEVLNSPLDALPDSIRVAIGKIALVTFLNAVAVIGYVLLFRKK